MKLKLFRTNLAHVTVGMLLMCACALLSPGCRLNPDENGGIPAIIHQPEDAEVFTNHETSLTVAIQRQPDQNYRFAWFREVLVPACTNPPGVEGLTLELQTNRPGWNSEVLHFPNAAPTDEGYYRCVITHEGTSEAPQELVEETRPAYVKVYGSSYGPPAGTNIFTVPPQPGTANLRGTQPSTTEVCDLSGYNTCKLFKRDDYGNLFTSPPTPSSCHVLLNTIDHYGNLHPVDPSQYTVQGLQLRSTNALTGITLCSSNTPSGPQFPVEPSTTYWLDLYLANATTAGATYLLDVSWR